MAHSDGNYWFKIHDGMEDRDRGEGVMEIKEEERGG